MEYIKIPIICADAILALGEAECGRLLMSLLEYSIQVENALLKRALGYEYMEERVEISEKDGRKVIQTTKTVPPDTTAQIFWLKNRRPDKWRDKPEEQTEAATQTIEAYLREQGNKDGGNYEY